MFGHKTRGTGHLVDALARIRLFAACTRDQLAALARLFTEVDRPAGTVLVREGTPGTEFFIIVDGTATATIGKHRVSTLGPGDFFGEMSLLDRAPRSATVTADTEMTLLVADAKSFSTLVASAPSVGARMMRTLAERLRHVEAPEPVAAR
jgi:protein phosphatase